MGGGITYVGSEKKLYDSMGIRLTLLNTEQLLYRSPHGTRFGSDREQTIFQSFVVLLNKQLVFKEHCDRTRNRPFSNIRGSQQHPYTTRNDVRVHMRYGSIQCHSFCRITCWPAGCVCIPSLKRTTCSVRIVWKSELHWLSWYTFTAGVALFYQTASQGASIPYVRVVIRIEQRMSRQPLTFRCNLFVMYNHGRKLSQILFDQRFFLAKPDVSR